MRNPGSDPRMEATLYLALEPDQHVDRFKVRVNGKEAEAELLDQEKARGVYEEIVRKQKDPALLEIYGNRLLRIRVFPVPPKSDFELEIETTEILHAEGGVVRVQTLNPSPASFVKPLARFTVDATVEAEKPIRNAFSPTHAVAVERKGAREVRIRYDRRDYVASGPFSFYYAFDERDIGATMLAHAEPGEDGTFMLTISPPFEVRDEDRLPRDVVFVVDRSGSMNEGGKMAQARKALARFVETLTDKDRFDIVSFATEAAAYEKAPVDVTPERRRRTAAYIETLRAGGGTNVEDALRLALELPWRDDATRIILLISDGTPTLGERDPEKIAALAAGKGVRVFAFGVGSDVNTQLLDRLAAVSGGDRQYVTAEEDLAVVLDAFARKIDAPVMSDPELTFDRESGAYEVFPKRVPDIFRGGEVTIFGRFRGAGPRRVEISGLAGGRRVTRTYDFDVAPSNRHDFVPRLWAIHKIDYLIDDMRRRGNSKEVVDHIIELAKKYAIVTPYTSFLMVEDTPVAVARDHVDSNLKSAQSSGFSGSFENHRATNGQMWRGATNNEAQIAAGNDAVGRSVDAKGIAQTLSEQRVVGNRAFYNGSKGWVESSFDKQTARVLKFGTDEYFRFARENPNAGLMLSLGQNVTFKNNAEWIRVEL